MGANAVARGDRPSGDEALPRLRLFGVPVLRTAAGSEQMFAPRRPFQMLAYLACRRSWVARAELAELFWPDRPEGAARGNLRVLLLRLQRQRGVEGLELEADRVRWIVDSDLARFDAAAAAGDDDAVVESAPGALLEGLEPEMPEPLLAWLDRERSRVGAAWSAAAQRVLAAMPHDLPRAMTLRARAVAADPDAATAAPVLDAAVRRLAPDAFIGRRAEIAEVAARLARADVRLLLLVGAGGVGKTALLRAAMPLLAPAFEGRVHAVPLADLDALAQVPARIAQAVGKALQPSAEAWRQVEAALAGASRLLLLDNAEHLEGLPGALGRLLEACPALKLLVATRVRFAGAAVLVLDGLPLPDDDETDVDVLRSYDVVRLFEARAREAAPQFDLGRDAASVQRVLRATDGMPLAVELAAAATRLVPLAEIAAELSRSLDVLDAAAPPGARGLRACFDRSWRGLGEAPQAALARLAWLPGPFDRELARGVADVSLAELAGLVDRSLLRVGPPGRFALHPLLRQFVAEQRVPFDTALLAARHAGHVEHLLAAGEHAGSAGYAAIDAELPHVRAAWAWAVAHGQASTLVRFARVMGRYHVDRGTSDEVVPFLAHAVAAIALGGRAGLAARAATRRTQAMLEYHRGALADAAAHAREALRWAQTAGETDTALGCLTVLGNALYFAGDVAAAASYFEQAYRRAVDRDNAAFAASASNGLGLIERAAGRYDTARAHYNEAGRLWRQAGDVPAQLDVLLNIGNLQMLQRDWQGALRTNEEALAAARGYAPKHAVLHTVLAQIRLELGDVARARTHAQAAIAALPQTMDVTAPTQAWLVTARIEAAGGDHAAAAAAFTNAVARARECGSTTMMLSCVYIGAQLVCGRGGAATAERLWSWVLAHPRCTAPARDAAQSGLRALGIVDAATALPPVASLDDAVDEVQAALGLERS